MALKPKYGIDAPGVIRNFFLFGLAGFIVVAFKPPFVHLGAVDVDLGSMGFAVGCSCSIAGVLMLLYAKVGKFKHRDRMLDLCVWRGDENVLDVGTGRGLVLIGAARRITTGHATGIDVWNKEDLSDNTVARTEQNLALEGVMEKCTLLSEGAQQMSFTDESFDVVLSNLCLHNIYDEPTRTRAVREIARVLKRGGTAVISDYKLTREYARILSDAGLSVERKAPNVLTTFPALTILVARKA